MNNNDPDTEPIEPQRTTPNAIGNNWLIRDNPFVQESYPSTEHLPPPTTGTWERPEWLHSTDGSEDNPIAYAIGAMIGWILIIASGLAAVAFLFLMIAAIGSMFL